MKSYVLGFIFSHDFDKILLIKKNRCPKGLEKMIGSLNAIGGKVEEGESFIQAMVRECKEETDLDIDESSWTCFATLKTRYGHVLCFATRAAELLDFNQKEDEFIAIYKVENNHDSYNYKKFRRMSNLDWLIPMAINSVDSDDECLQYNITEFYDDGR